MLLATWGAGDGAERDPFGGWLGVEMSPQALQEHSLAAAGASSVCLCSPRLAPGTPRPPQRLPQHLGPCWDGVTSLLFTTSFVGLSLSFPWLWGSQMHRGGCGHPGQAALPSLMSPSRPAPLAG